MRKLILFILILLLSTLPMPALANPTDSVYLNNIHVPYGDS